LDLQTVKLMALYNSSANTRMNEIIRGISDEQWNRDFMGYFRSIKALCNHLYIADYVWLKRFAGLRNFRYMGNELFSTNINFGMVVLSSIIDYLDKRKMLDNIINHFAEELTIKGIESVLEYKDSGGNDHTRNFGGLVLHMFNHQTHHRAMISLYLENQGIDNDYNSIFDILGELKK